ncbi:pentatricopeptide repeat-containing protein At1g74600, chloroplastic-like [Magnolia sinica]|uniref:pentatricopeptide repeat-containing protein At1g74600, chloroplastic-like n=1 Tax=Magnolia sinica TaxID=86752 RepID=UPI002659467B|nr:pentatricopeptide repeat-containing protein At1g74600, chloroplastic-like [Magnolia sinica]
MKRISLPYNPFHLFNHMKKPTMTGTKIIHAQLIKTPLLQSDLFVANSLADCYCKSAAMVYALNVFNEIPEPNLVSWNLMISGYNQRMQFDESMRMFCRMYSSGFEPNQITYGSILSACAASQALRFGEQVYSLITKNGFFSDGHVCTGMIDLFAKTCCFEDALKVFSEVSSENVVCWNAIIAGGVRNKENWISLDLFHRMVCGSLTPNGFTFSSILTACASVGELDMGRGIHGWVIKCGAEDDIFVGTAIIDMYVKCGDVNEAVKEFSWMPSRNHVSWTAIISGFVQVANTFSALNFFKEMKATGVEINNFTVTSVLTACGKPELAKEAMQIHGLILKSGFSMDSSVKDALIIMYANIGDIGLSERVFEEMGSMENVGTWAAMISAFAKNVSSRRSVELFQRMFREGLRPNRFCCSSVLSIVSCVNLGKQIHSYIVKAGLDLDVSVGSALFTMYSKCGSLEDGYDVFKQMPEKDGVSWTSMIAGFAEHGLVDQAFCLFREMLVEEVRPDQMTLSAVLTACSVCQSLRKGKEIHGYALRVGFGTETLVGSALVNMYSKCKALVSARRIFDAMPQKDQISWSSLVSSYAQNRHSEEALLQFHQMLIAGMKIDCFTISSILGVSATLTRPGLGKQLHAHTVKIGIDLDLSVSSSLITLYSKCGSIDDSRKVFDQIDKPDLVTWTAMIDGYAQHGQGVEALKIYEMMREEGMEPDSVTFVGVLSACSHNGLVEEGYFHLNSMATDYGIKPEARHYACMVDLLSRAGRLREAERFIETMPIKPDALMWGTLLGACRIYGDVELGRSAAKKVLELEPCDSGAYVSLSNICADAGDWEEVLKIRNLMKGVGVKKEPGWSFV